jgi:hypothetical protein
MTNIHLPIQGFGQVVVVHIGYLRHVNGDLDEGWHWLYGSISEAGTAIC